MTNKDDDIIPSETRAMADIPPPPPPPPESPSPDNNKSPHLLSTPINNNTYPEGEEEEEVIGSGGGAGTISTTASSSNIMPSSPTNSNDPSLLSPPLLLEIEEGTPAAEALKANADVRVSKLRKVGRSTRLQAGVRVIKSSVKMASGQPGHAGDRRGAPAFVSPRTTTTSSSSPPTREDLLRKSMSINSQIQLSAAPTPTIPEVDDEFGEGGDDSDRYISYVGTATVAASSKTSGWGGGGCEGESGDESLFTTDSIDILDDSNSTDRQIGGRSGTNTELVIDALDKQQSRQQEKQQTQSQLLTTSTPSFRHNRHATIDHVTNPAQVAAACRAGEDLDRQRASYQSRIPADTASLNDLDAPSVSSLPIGGKPRLESLAVSFANSPFATLFKSTANLSSASAGGGGDDHSESVRSGNVPQQHQLQQQQQHHQISPLRPSIKHRRTASVPEVEVRNHRRKSVDKEDRMPSEISVTETERHSNIITKQIDKGDHIEQGDNDEGSSQRSSVLSDDGIISELLMKDDTTNTSLIVDFPAAKDEEEIETKAVKKRGTVGINPIVVEIPGRREPIDIEETKEEETDDNNVTIDEESSQQRKAIMSKAKSWRSSKKKDKSNLHDDEAFHFHGPKQVRKWVKRRRDNANSQNKRSYVKGKVIDGKHELYTMSIAVMFGMRTSIGRTNLAMSQTARNERRWLDNDDLMAVEKYEFPPRGSDMTPPHQLNHTFKFKDYSPLAFAYLRRMFGVNEYDFLLSVCGNANYIEFQSNAKSGQFFFYSPDGKYMIKTMTNTESKFLRRILPHYFRHCAKNPNTLITKFLGMYRVKLYHLRRNVKFVVMKSIYDTDKYLNQLFDVKGSTTGRDANPGDAVKKDNDIRRMLPDGAFVLNPSLRIRLRTQVEHDCQWLKSMKIMDYSMLVGVHYIAHRNTKVSTSKSATQPASRVQFNDDEDRSEDHSASSKLLDRFLDIDDDDSYLEDIYQKGRRARKASHDESDGGDSNNRTVRFKKSSYLPDNDNDAAEDESSKEGGCTETDALVEKAVEDMYWPFHRFYDIQGLRRMNPIRAALLASGTRTRGGETNQIANQPRQEEKLNFFHTVFPSGVQGPHDEGGGNDLPAFDRPLSYRKDAGFMMDTSQIDLPVKISVAGAPHLAEYCDGKIFYMGIIDILQQFNIRKRGEARWRRVGGKGWEAASCVHPNVYADRFLRFFDEYTEYQTTSSTPDDDNENAITNAKTTTPKDKVSFEG